MTVAFGKKRVQVEDEAPVETPEPLPEVPAEQPAEAPPREFRHDSYPP